MARSDSRGAWRGAVLVGTLILTGCSAAPAASTPPSTVMATAAPSVATPAPTPTLPPAIVGVWVGVHQCQRIMDVMTAAGMREQGLSNIVDAGTLPGVTKVADIKDPANPCVGAVEVKHSHFFTAQGAFGSRDSIGTQVDDGTWTLRDSDTILIGDVPFDFTITGDALRLQPVSVGPCPTGSVDWCEEAWKLMVAMPGMEWHRQP